MKNNKKRHGFFITFEGTDGTGKSTHIKLLAKWLEQRRVPVVLTREPGGGGLSEKIRGVLLDPRLNITEIAELFLYEAARADHMAHVVRPALAKGKWVLCDRFTDATLAYQGTARGLPMQPIHYLNRLATGGRKPDLTLWLDLPPSQGLRRAFKLKKGHDRIEKEGLRFQDKVRRGYQLLAKKEPRRIRRIEVQQSVDDTQALIRAVVGKFL